jgi:excisionase family DNA binding protein
METEIKSEYLTHKEAAFLLRISPKTLYNKVVAGDVPVHKRKGFRRNLYRKAELDALVRPHR